MPTVVSRVSRTNATVLTRWDAPCQDMKDLLDRSEAAKWGLGFGSVSMLIILFFLWNETQKCMSGDSVIDYFTAGFWNLLPMTASLLGLASFILFCADAGVTAVRGVASCAVVLFWFNLFNYLRAIRKLSSVCAGPRALECGVHSSS